MCMGMYILPCVNEVTWVNENTWEIIITPQWIKSSFERFNGLKSQTDTLSCNILSCSLYINNVCLVYIRRAHIYICKTP